MPLTRKSRKPRFAIPLQYLTEHSLDFVFVIDPATFAVLGTSPAVTETLGYSEDEWQRLSFREILPNSAWARVSQMLSDSQCPEAKSVSTSLVDAGSCEIPVRLIVRHDAKHGVAIVTARETTNDRGAPPKPETRLSLPDLAVEETEKALRENEERFQTLAVSVPVGIFLTDAAGLYLYVNDRWSLIAGMSIGEASGEGWIGHIHELDRERVVSSWYEAVKAGREFSAEFRFANGGEEVKWVLGHALPYPNAAGQYVGYLGTILDITERRRAEESLRASEERYRFIFENVLDVYYETDLDGTILEVGPAIKRFSGYRREDLLGRSMMDFYVDVDARSRLVDQLKATGSVNDYEIRLKDRRGRPVYGAITSKMIFDEDGKPLKITGSLRNITERKLAEDLLRSERQVLELVTKDVPLDEILDAQLRTIEKQAVGTHCSILLLDETGTTLSHGGAPSLPKEYTEAIDGLRIGDGVGSCGSAAFRGEKVVVTDIATDPSWEAYRELALKHGLRACWSVPIRSSGNKILGTFAVYYSEPGEPEPHHEQLIDAAVNLAAVAIERKYAQDEREKLEAQMRQAQKLESLGVLAGGIAHDFNNLLTGIMGYASLAKRHLANGENRALKHVTEIEKVSQRAAHLTNQMLAYSGKGKFIIESLNLSEVVKDLAELLQASISKKARIVYDFAEDLPPIEADVTQVQQVVMNLITNASDALGDDNGTIRISTGVVAASPDYLSSTSSDYELPEGIYVYTEVSDSGCGMDEETLQRIFDPFFTTKFTGRGLGLSAVLGIMRGHRGTIRIQSEPGKGTSIRVLFPAQAERRSEDTAHPSSMGAADDERGHGMVLVVDDEKMIRSVARKILEASGYTTVVAENGRRGVKLFRERMQEIRVVLLDLTMPDMDGIETLAELRRVKDDVRVVLTSGYNEHEVSKRLPEDGCAAFIQKPFTEESLRATIRKALE